MKRDLCIFAILAFVCLSDIFPGQHEDESYIIRRIYLDVLGVVPLPHEIDWYCVYNDNGYNMAVEWVLARPRDRWTPGWDHMSVEDIRKTLTSQSYKNFKKMPLSREQLNRQLCYIAGEEYSGDYSRVIQARSKLIKYALEATDSDVDAIDHLAYQLMSRVTTMTEANYLKGKLKDYKATAKTEQLAWENLLDELLGFEDVRNR
jgi:hypothetical protein